MRCDVHCPKKGGGGKVAAAVVGAGVLAAVWRLVPGIVLAAGITVVVLCAAGIAVFAWVMRPVRLSGPVRAGLPAPGRGAVGGARRAAIEGARRTVPGIVLGTRDERTKR